MALEGIDLTTTLEDKLDFLKSIGAEESGHHNQKLDEHLIGVMNILKEQGAPEYLQDAGLFHSVYGTASYHHQSTNDRDAVRALIGEQAEEIVFWFCACKKPRLENILKLPEQQLKHDLLSLNWANEDDMRKTDVPRLEGYNDV